MGNGAHDEPGWLDEQEFRAWFGLAALTLFLPGRLDEALRPHGMTFFDYSIMAGLSEAPDRTLPMSTLSHVANGSLSRLSHAAKRLEKRGWLRRYTSPEDGRVTLATMTDEGQAVMVRAAPDHVASVRRAIFDLLSAEQVDQLGEIAMLLAEGLNPEAMRARPGAGSD